MIKRFILIGVLISVLAFQVKAQPRECTDPSHPCFTECNTDCGGVACVACLDALEIPLDGGLIWLILGGAGLGVRSLVKRKKKG